MTADQPAFAPENLIICLATRWACSVCLSVIGEDRVAVKLVGDAGADIADRYSMPAVGRIGRGAHEARCPEIGVAILDAPENIVREGVIEPGTGGPASEMPPWVKNGGAP